ncbi:MAG: hypothetical protein NTW58_02790 [Actinobacteria bacterium]|nr:hypothetical protein [Actinomycetota bacterium]
MTRPAGATGGFTDLEPLTANPDPVANEPSDFGWEACWGIPGALAGLALTAP